MKVTGNEIVQAMAYLAQPNPKCFRVPTREIARDIKVCAERMGRKIRLIPDSGGFRVKRMTWAE